MWDSSSVVWNLTRFCINPLTSPSVERAGATIPPNTNVERHVPKIFEILVFQKTFIYVDVYYMKLQLLVKMRFSVLLGVLKEGSLVSELAVAVAGAVAVVLSVLVAVRAESSASEWRLLLREALSVLRMPAVFFLYGASLEVWRRQLPVSKVSKVK